MPDQPSITFRVYAPDLEVDSEAFNLATCELRNDGNKVELDSPEGSPCGGGTYAAILFTMVALPTAKHYVDKILDGFDALIKKGSVYLALLVQIDEKSVYAKVPLQDREAAKKALGEAFFELSVGINDPERIIFLVDAASIREDKVILLETSGWLNTSYWKKGNWIHPQSQDYDFWIWTLNDRRKSLKVTDLEILEYRDQFCATTDPTRARRPELLFSNYRLGSTAFSDADIPK